MSEPTKNLVLANRTRVSREDGGPLGPTLATGTPVRAISPSPHHKGWWSFEYSTGSSWRGAFTSPHPETRDGAYELADLLPALK